MTVATFTPDRPHNNRRSRDVREVEDLRRETRRFFFEQFIFDLQERPVRLLGELFLYRTFRLFATIFYWVVAIVAMAFVVHSCIGAYGDIPSMFSHSGEDGSANATITVLSLLDDAMVVNVIYLIVGGSYLVYVRSNVMDSVFLSEQRRPQAFQHLSSGTLKEKMASSLVGVSSVYLLRVLINATSQGFNIDWKPFVMMITIHAFLILGFLAYVVANRVSATTHIVEHESEEPGEHALAASHAPELTAGHHDLAATLGSMTPETVAQFAQFLTMFQQFQQTQVPVPAGHASESPAEPAPHEPEHSPAVVGANED